MRVNMCMRGLEEGIRVLTTYGLAFLSSIPAVSTGTMGSLLQTGKLMNILGVKCFYSFKYSVPGSGLICHILHTHWSINDVSDRVVTCLPTSKSSLELHFKLDRTIPPIPPLLTWQTRPESNPRAVLWGWFGGQWLAGEPRRKEKSEFSAVKVQTENLKQPGKKVNLHDL